MKIHLRQIPEEGLHLEGEEDINILDLQDDQQVARQTGPMRYALNVGKNTEGLWVTGSVSVDVELECVRCLEHFVYPLKVDDLALQMELPATETLDLTPHLREDILLTLPAYPHCDWSGERVCPGEESIGAVRHQEPDGEASQPSPPSAWATLDQLNDPSSR